METPQSNNKSSKELEAKVILGTMLAKKLARMTPEEAKEFRETLKQEEPQYLTEAHRVNSEGAMKAEEESKRSPMSLKEALKQQIRNSKDSDQTQAQQMNSEIDWDQELKRLKHNSKDH